jgi:hypothetical protein
MGICRGVLLVGRKVMRTPIGFGLGVCFSPSLFNPFVVLFPKLILVTVMGYSSEGLPQVGLVPREEDRWIIEGFTGHGMPQLSLAAEGLAKMVLNRTRFENTGLPRLFQTTRGRLDSTENTIAHAIFKPEAPAARL